MCRKLVCFVFVFGLVLTSTASAADPNLVGWWRFDGDAFDSSGNQHNGTLVGGPQWVDGISGRALAFDAGSHVEVTGYEGISGGHARTCCAWIRLDRRSASILTWGPAGGGTKWNLRTHEANGAFRLEVGQGYLAGVTPVDDGEWHHVAAVLEDDGSPDVVEAKLYVDGAVETDNAQMRERQVATGTGVNVHIAYDFNSQGRYLVGSMDDVRIYDRALNADEILAVVDNPAGTVTQAVGPDPRNKAMIDSPWYTLNWKPSDTAVSHQLYISDSFDDVNEGTVEAIPTTDTFFLLGFDEPYPNGLTPGGTYYWRVDEVNEADPDSPWKGSIWSFKVRPENAWNPMPADGAKFVDPNADLSWNPGVGAVTFYVYFSDNFEDVNSAADANEIGVTTYDPGPLEQGKTYYWRVDESDMQTIHRGKVWSFTVTVPGGGLKGEYFNNMTLSGEPVLTRIDPGVDFNLGTGSAEPNVVNEDGFSVRWTGELVAVFSEEYTFYTRAKDGTRLWIDDQLVVDKWVWVNTVADARSEPIQLVAGQWYRIRMEWYNNDESAEAHLLWESASQVKSVIPAAALSLPVRASGANPSDGAVDIGQTAILRWSASEAAASHDVYFGSDPEAVKNADTTSPEYKGTRAIGNESYDAGILELETTYYWRIDEVNSVHPDSPWVGRVWSFTIGAFLTVDDFENYTDDDAAGKAVWQHWIDGVGTTTNGAVIGENLPPYCEQIIVHSGAQSTIYRYDNNFMTSEATLTLVYPRDWTAEGVTKLSLWFQGASDNAAERMFVALNGTAVVYHDDPAVTQKTGWNEWVIDLQAFADQGVDLTNVNTITIGFGTKDSPAAGGTGVMYFDDIRLYAPAQ